MPFMQLLLLAVLILPALVHGGEVVSTASKCETEQDVNFEDCWMHHLKVPALDAICKRVGVNATTDVFPYLEEVGKSPSHDDYVTAAYECLMIEQDIHFMLQDYNLLPEEILEDRQGMALLVQNALEKNPHLLGRITEELQQRKPELWKAIHDELGGKSLDSRTFSSLLLGGQR